jgi:hypothetical protein
MSKAYLQQGEVWYQRVPKRNFLHLCLVIGSDDIVVGNDGVHAWSIGSGQTSLRVPDSQARNCWQQLKSAQESELL